MPKILLTQTDRPWDELKDRIEEITSDINSLLKMVGNSLKIENDFLLWLYQAFLFLHSKKLKTDWMLDTLQDNQGAQDYITVLATHHVAFNLRLDELQNEQGSFGD